MNYQHNWQYTSQGFFSPAPVIQINVYNIKSGKDDTIDFLIDSGADISLIKKDIFTNLGLIKIDEVEFEVADSDEEENEPKKRDVTELGFKSPELNLTGKLEIAVGKGGETNLLGRDFLNSFHIILNRGKDFTIQR